MKASHIKVAHGLPLVKDMNGQVWCHLGIERHDGINMLSTPGGMIDKTDKSLDEGFIRELSEELLNVFGSHKLAHPIDLAHLKNKDKTQYTDFSGSRFYVTASAETFDPNNDAFIKEFALRRAKPGLKHCQKEVSTLRRVKIEDLLAYVKNPKQFPEGLTNYGAYGSKEKPLPIRSCSKNWLSSNRVQKMVIDQHHKLISGNVDKKQAVLPQAPIKVVEPIMPQVGPQAKLNGLSKVKIDFEHGLLDPNVRPDALVNAANIHTSKPSSWHGIAGAIYKALSPIDQNILTAHWKAIGDKQQCGSASIVKDSKNQPYDFILKGRQHSRFIIHAGSPDFRGKSDQEKVELTKQLGNAYAAILEAVKQHNTTNSKKINKLALPPLGIGIYEVPPNVSAQCAFNALKAFYEANPTSNVEVTIPLFGGKDKNSNDYAFGMELQKLLNSYQNKPIVWNFDNKAQGIKAPINNNKKNMINDVKPRKKGAQI